MSAGRTKESLAQSEKDDYNVRNYAYHIYFAYVVALYALMMWFSFFRPETMVRFYQLDEQLGEAGKYYARQGAGLLAVFLLVTLHGWFSGSAHVRDLAFKCHFAHHLFGLLTDWYCEHLGLVPVKHLEGLYSPHPFFTFLVYFMWRTDKRRNRKFGLWFVLFLFAEQSFGCQHSGG